MNRLNDIAKELRDAKEVEGSTDLTITKEKFMEKMKQEENGEQLLYLLESGEHRICERMGLIHGYLKDCKVYYDIPGWNNLVKHLQMVHGA